VFSPYGCVSVLYKKSKRAESAFQRARMIHEAPVDSDDLLGANYTAHASRRLSTRCKHVTLGLRSVNAVSKRRT